MRPTFFSFRQIAVVFSAVALVAISGCGSLGRLPHEPPSTFTTAQPDIAGCLAPDAGAATDAGEDLGRLEQCRFLPTRDVSSYAAEARTSLRRESAWWNSTGHTGPLPPVSILAVSGGGDDGAFGAGLLVGWTQAGTRPQFKVVTGVSTGALIAPYAFLGSRYDAELEAAYTQVSQRDIFKSRGFLGALTSDAFSDTAPLARELKRQVTQHMLDDIAAEYRKGRVLLVGTSDLDAVEPVIWNLTAIAASKDPHALALFRQILLASASIPGAFPPQMIKMRAGAERYQEMHVDGGTLAQVFVYPPSVRINEAGRQAGVDRPRTLYVIRNARMDNEQVSVERRTLSIVPRSVSALLQSQGVGDLYRIYFLAQRDDIDFNLAYIPNAFTGKRTKGQFDQAYMRSVFDYARDLARAGYPWEKHPPGLVAPTRAERASR